MSLNAETIRRRRRERQQTQVLESIWFELNMASERTLEARNYPRDVRIVDGRR